MDGLRRRGWQYPAGALIALFVFCALAAFEALAPVTGAFQHLGQVIASALRITELTEQQPEVTFPDASSPVSEQVTLTLRDVSFSYPGQAQKRSTPFRCRLSPVNTLRFSVAPAAVSQRYYNC